MSARKRVLAIALFSALLLVVNIGLSMGHAARALPESSSDPVGTTIPYAGRLSDDAGQPVAEGGYAFTFTLYDTLSGGQPLWSEVQDSVAVKGGSFTVSLGSITPIPPVVLDGRSLWLAVEVRGPDEAEFTALAPRQQVSAAAPAPFRSPSGTAATAACPHDHWGESWSGGGTGLTLSGGSTGLAGSGTTYGVYGRSDSPSGLGVNGWATATGHWTTYGVRGRSDAEQGRGVFGYATATSGENYGVRGVTDSLDGYGVYGWNTATGVPGYGVGVYGRTSSIAGYGVFGYAGSESGVATGVQGRSDSEDGYGVLGWADASSGENYGVFGTTFSPDGYGGYFSGRLHARAGIDAVATPENHVAHFDNWSGGTSPDVLALQVGYTGDPGEGINFVTFFKGDDTAVGAIEGDGSGGVTYKSGAADFAEFLPRRDAEEAIEPGDLVGVFGGRVTRATRGADRVLAVSGGPIVLGNDPGDEEAGLYEKVALLGQVRVQVRGPVAAGDLIVPSGLDDGTGLAVAPEAITAEQFAQAVGQAWESSPEEGVKRVLVAIGLLHHDPTVAQLAGQFAALEAENAEQDARLAALEAALAGPSGTRWPSGRLLLSGLGVAAAVVVGRQRVGGGR